MRTAALLTCWFWCGWLWTAAAQAVTVSDLYQVSVMVQDQTENSRNQGLQQALQQVLVKVSGSRDSVQLLQQASPSPQQLVESFSYRRDPVDDALLLQVQFASNLIDQLLIDAGQPVWGQTRPLLLVWQAVEEGPLRMLLGQDVSLWRVQADRAMHERGLPVLWPTLDLEDEIALPVEAVWGSFRDRIIDASQRYRHDAILAGRLAAAGNGQWRYDGQLWHQQQWLPISVVANDAGAAMQGVADQVARYFAARYAVRRQVQTSGGFSLVVDGVASFADYQMLLRYLKANVAIDEVQVLAANGPQLQLELQLAAPWPQVWGVLSLDKRLQQTEQPGVVQWQSR